MKLKRVLGIGAAVLAAIAAGGYWYVFVDGAHQFDGPNSAAAAEKTNLKYSLESYNSSVMGMSRTYGVMLPPGYQQNSKQRYPVIFLLHGGHGDPTDWFKKAAALPVIQKLYDNHQLPPSIIITPDGNDLRGSSPFWDPDYTNGKNGQVLNAIGDELVQVVQSRYRTKPSPHFWAIGGLSSGGWGALNIGLHRPQRFSILFSHSGYFLAKGNAENSPMSYVAHLKPSARKNLFIYLDAGESDGEFLTQSQELHQQLNQLGVNNQFHEFPGGHGIYGGEVGWNYWHRHLADSLSYVGDRFLQAEKAAAKVKSHHTTKKPAKPHK